VTFCVSCWWLVAGGGGWWHAQDLGALESILSRVLPEHKVAYVLGGLEGLVASIVVRTLPKVKAFNPNGVWKMCRYTATATPQPPHFPPPTAANRHSPPPTG
jgi:hypothetical protein